MDTQNIRLKVLYKDYILNPDATILSLIGYDAKIINKKQNPIIMDNYTIIDVEYSIFELNPLLIYWIEQSKFKQQNGISDNDYIVEIDNYPIMVTLFVPLKNFKNKIPIKINKILPNTFNSNIEYKYYGLLVDNPLNNFYSTMSTTAYNSSSNLSSFDEILKMKSFKNNYDNVKEYGKIIDEELFKVELKIYVYSRVMCNKFEDIKFDTTKSYVIDVRKINFEKLKNGIIIMLNKRNFFDVVYIPQPMFTISQYTLNNLFSFIKIEYENYSNWIVNM